MVLCSLGLDYSKESSQLKSTTLVKLLLALFMKLLTIVLVHSPSFKEIPIVSKQCYVHQPLYYNKFIFYIPQSISTIIALLLNCSLAKKHPPLNTTAKAIIVYYKMNIDDDIKNLLAEDDEPSELGNKQL